MIRAGDMIENPVTGERILFRKTSEETNGEMVLVETWVQPGGTAAITDAGMTGPHDSVIGVRAELAIERMRTAMPVRFHPAEGGVRIEGAVIECDAEGRATRCEPLRVLVD